MLRILAGWAEGDVRVYCGTHRSGALAALILAGALSGCGSDFDTGTWFAKPLDVVGKAGGYTYSELQETQRRHEITPNDLADASGNCPAPAMPAQAPPPAGAPGEAAPAAPDVSSQLGEGVALGMSECDVIHRAGQPTTIQLGNNPNGQRTALMTYNSGPRPGIYHFEGGRLMQMDRVEVAPPPEAVKKKPAKPAKKKNDQA
jgi:hypothetical protein